MNYGNQMSAMASMRPQNPYMGQGAGMMGLLQSGQQSAMANAAQGAGPMNPQQQYQNALGAMQNAGQWQGAGAMQPTQIQQPSMAGAMQNLMSGMRQAAPQANGYGPAMGSGYGAMLQRAMGQMQGGMPGAQSGMAGGYGPMLQQMAMRRQMQPGGFAGNYQSVLSSYLPRSLPNLGMGFGSYFPGA